MGILCFFWSLIFSPFPLLFFLLLNDFTTTKNTYIFFWWITTTKNLVWRGVCVHICNDIWSCVWEINIGTARKEVGMRKRLRKECFHFTISIYFLNILCHRRTLTTFPVWRQRLFYFNMQCFAIIII